MQGDGHVAITRSSGAGRDAPESVPHLALEQRTGARQVELVEGADVAREVCVERLADALGRTRVGVASRFL